MREVVHADGAQLLECSGPRLGAPHPAHAQREGDVGEHAHVREDAGGLGDHGDAAAARGHERDGVVDDALADAGAALVEAQRSGDHLGERRLSRAVVTDDGRHEAGAKLRVHVPAACLHASGDAHVRTLPRIFREHGRGRGGGSGRSAGSGGAPMPRR